MADDPESTLLVYSEDGKLLQPDLSNRNIRAAFETGLATPSSSDALLARCVKALAQLQWGFEGHSSCLSELYGGLAQLFAADRPTELGEDGAVASDRYGFETDTLQTHFVPLLAADLAADGAAGDEDTAGRPTTAAIVALSIVVSLGGCERDGLLSLATAGKLVGALSDALLAARGAKTLGLVAARDLPDGCTVVTLLRCLYHTCFISDGDGSLPSSAWVNVITSLVDILKTKKSKQDPAAELWALRVLSLISIECDPDKSSKGATKAVKGLAKNGLTSGSRTLAASLMRYLAHVGKLQKVKVAAPATERCICVAGGPDDVDVMDKLEGMCASFNVKCLRAGTKPTSPQETERQLTLATTVVVVVSRQTKASMDTWVDTLYASQLGIPIVCALRDPTAPTGWLKQQFEMLSWVDINDDSFDQNAKGLLSQFQPGRRGASTLRKALNASHKSPELLHPIFSGIEKIEEEGEGEGDTSDDAAEELRITVGELEAKLGDLASKMVAKDDLEAMIAAAVQAAIVGHGTRLAGYESKCVNLEAELKEAQESLTLLRERLDTAASLSPSAYGDGGGGGGGVAMRKPSNTKGVFPSPNPKELSARSQMAQVLNGGKGGGLFGGGMPKLNKTSSPAATATVEEEPDRNSQLHEVFGAAD